MPNWVKNVLVIGSDHEKVLEFIKGEETAFDFNKVIEMPQQVDIPSSNRGIQGLEYLALANNFVSRQVADKRKEEMIRSGCFDEAVELGRKYMRNIADYGAPTWYEWCIKNWGTKWNASEVKICDNEITFDTAWSCPLPVIQKLSEQFPGIEFNLAWSDEDIGSNVGKAKLFSGEADVDEYVDGSKEAYDLAFELHPGMKEYYAFVDGKYTYNEDE